MKRFIHNFIFHFEFSKQKKKVENVMDVFYKANVTDGLFHEQWNFDDGTPWGGKFYHTNDELKPYHFFEPIFFLLWIDHFTIGPPSDSGYEYLLKQWIQSGDPKARQQC